MSDQQQYTHCYKDFAQDMAKQALLFFNESKGKQNKQPRSTP
ncbi:hypothetical protein [Noviherbaspirillum cavernae]|nr:hypothetical protein [Noviherbaspirillum cavernae]